MSCALNLRGFKSHDNETWHVGPLSDLDVHGLFGILIYGRIGPQAQCVRSFSSLLSLKTQVARSYGGFAVYRLTAFKKSQISAIWPKVGNPAYQAQGTTFPRDNAGLESSSRER